jgi:hypothetical protein
VSDNLEDLLHRARTEDIDDSLILRLAVIGENERKIIDILKGGGSHLLQGARGCGKSMLFKTAESELDNAFQKDKCLGVYVNFKTSTLLEGVKADHRDAFQIWVGAKILQALFDKLTALNLIGSETATDPFHRIFGIKSIFGMKQAIQEKIHLLQKLSKKESIKKTIEDLGEDFLDKAYDIGYLHEVLKEIVNEYQIQRVIFLFDEAAHTFIPSQQEIFFEIFKLLHGGNIAVKAAVYPTVTSYGRNFEIGHDAIVVEMGKFQPGTVGRSSNRTMFRELLGKRLPAKPSIRKKIYSKGQLLDHCIDLSTGNPRTFLHLFNRLFDKGYTDRALSLVTQEYIDDELLPYHKGLTKRLPKYAHHVKIGLDLLRGYIIPEIRKKNHRDKKTKYQSAFFTTQRDLPANLKLALDILSYSGILSKQGTVKIAERKTGQRYMVHLAYMYTEKAFSSTSLATIMVSLSLTDYREFSSADPQLDTYLKSLKEAADECTQCSAELPSNAKFCLECGHKVEQTSIIGQLLEERVFELSISDKIATRLERGFPKVGDVIHATRNEIMRIPYIKEVRSKIIKNAADQFISG